MAPSTKLKVIEQCRVRPSSPSSAPPPASLPLTFFDILFLRFPPVQRLFFYEYCHQTARFLGSDLPTLKHSLATALRRFYPLAGTLLDEADREKPEIFCSNEDSVPLTVALSPADFDELSGNHPRAVADFRPLVPPLLQKSVFAVQVTVFPNAGIGIGTSLHHAVADGSTYTHFMKTWASLCRGGATTTTNFAGAGVLPFFDRAVVRDPAGLDMMYMEDLKVLKKDGDRSLEAWDLRGQPDVVMATFVFGRERLGELGTRTATRCSPYALACGYVWSRLVIARGGRSRRPTERFGFVTGCRPRVDPPLPGAYFGNCLGICRAEARRKDLVGENGGAVAAEAIWRVIGRLGEGAFAGAERWVRDVFGYASEEAVTVAGSPKLGIYGVDFGWGRPRKVEVVSIERTGALSLAESRDEPGGIEVGLALPRGEMEVFASFFTVGLV